MITRESLSEEQEIEDHSASRSFKQKGSHQTQRNSTTTKFRFAASIVVSIITMIALIGGFITGNMSAFTSTLAFLSGVVTVAANRSSIKQR